MRQTTTSTPPSRILMLMFGGLLVTLTFSTVTALIPQNYLLYGVFGIVICVIGLFLLVRPEWALLITIAYIPFESSEFRPFPLPDQLSVVKILGLVLLGTFFFNIVFRRRPFRLLDDLHDFGVLLLLAILLFSGLVSAMPGEVIDSTFRLIRLFAFYFAVKNLVSTPRMMRLILWAITLTGTYASAFGLNLFFEARTVRIHDVRVGGVYMDPNDFAAMAVLVIIVIVYLVHITRATWIRVALIVSALINLYALVLSGSRGGMLALAVVMLLYILRHPHRLRFLIGAVLVAVVALPLLPESVTDRFVDLNNDGTRSIYNQTADFSAERRVHYLEVGTRLFATHPVLGVGYGTFPFLFVVSPEARIYNPMTETQALRVAHNAYLEMATGMGFLGLAAFLLIMAASWYTLHTATRQLERGTVAWAAASAFELGLVSILITNIFLSNQDSKHLWMIVGFSSALAFYVRHSVRHAISEAPAA